MSANDAVLLLYGGPPLLVIFMFVYGLSLIREKPYGDPPTFAAKSFGWFLILLSLAIVILAVMIMMQKK